MRYEVSGEPNDTLKLGREKSACHQFAKDNQVHVHLMKCASENRSKKSAAAMSADRFLAHALKAATTGAGRDFRFGGWSVYTDYERQVTSSSYTYSASTEAAVALVSPSRRHMYFYLADVNAKQSAYGIINDVVPGAGIMHHGIIKNPELQRKDILKAVTEFMIDAAEKGDRKLVQGLIRACEREEVQEPGTIAVIRRQVLAREDDACSRAFDAARMAVCEPIWDAMMRNYEDTGETPPASLVASTEEEMDAAADNLPFSEIENEVVARYAVILDALPAAETETESESESLAPAA